MQVERAVVEQLEDIVQCNIWDMVIWKQILFHSYLFHGCHSVQEMFSTQKTSDNGGGAWWRRAEKVILYMYSNWLMFVFFQKHTAVHPILLTVRVSRRWTVFAAANNVQHAHLACSACSKKGTLGMGYRFRLILCCWYSVKKTMYSLCSLHNNKTVITTLSIYEQRKSIN